MKTEIDKLKEAIDKLAEASDLMGITATKQGRNNNKEDLAKELREFLESKVVEDNDLI